MPKPVRKLQPGEVVIGFVRPDGALIGELADASIDHDAFSYTLPGLRAKIQAGQAIGITIGKTRGGDVKVFGSGAFPPPGGGSLSKQIRDVAAKLVE